MTTTLVIQIYGNMAIYQRETIKIYNKIVETIIKL